MQALLPRLADLEPLVRVRLLLAALYLRPDEAAAIRSELQVRGLVLRRSTAQAIRGASWRRIGAAHRVSQTRPALLDSCRSRHNRWDNITLMASVLGLTPLL